MGNKSSKKKKETKEEKGPKHSSSKKSKSNLLPTQDPATPKTEKKLDGPTPSASAKLETSPKSDKSDVNKESTSSEGDGTIADVLCEAAGSASKKITKDNFEILKVIGRGSFGKVLQVKKKDTGEVFAMKVMRKENIIAKNQITHTKDEKNVLERIQHPFIVKLHYAFQTPEKLYMILDFVNGGELFYHLKKAGKFGENRVRLYAAEIASALIHLHNNGIVYRDLKPENLLLSSAGHVVITDFGLSKEIQPNGTTHTFCGTPEYLAPEVLTGEGHAFPVDWWALGTLIYEMLTGLPPFYSEVTAEMYQKIVSGDLEMSDEACDLLSRLLERDPDERLGADHIKEQPWFAGIDWDLLVEKKIKPEFVPAVRDAQCVSQIDEYFLQEVPEDSLVKKKVLANATGKDSELFEGFTYADPSVLNSEKM